MSWLVVDKNTNQEIGQHKTRKAATAAAKEMTDAHAAISAKHDGEPVTFSVEKRVEQEPVAEEAPVEDQ